MVLDNMILARRASLIAQMAKQTQSCTKICLAPWARAICRSIESLLNLLAVHFPAVAMAGFRCRESYATFLTFARSCQHLKPHLSLGQHSSNRVHNYGNVHYQAFTSLILSAIVRRFKTIYIYIYIRRPHRGTRLGESSR